jgi:hypothetical protein
MKRFLQKWFSMVNKRDLVTSVTASLIVLGMIACGGSTGVLPIRGVTNSRTIHLATSQRAGSHIFPGAGTKPFLAGMFDWAVMFQATPAASRLQQSYDAVCNFQPGFLEFVSPGSLVPLAMAGENNSCTFFTGPQGDGKQTIFEGTLSSLVVTGKTVAGVAFQCRDVDTTAAASDNSFTRAYLDPNAHTVAVFNGLNGTITRVPFACSGIGTATDQVGTIEAQWAKI